MGKIKLLVVEDNKINQKLYDASIKEDIFEKRVVRDGLKALKVYEEWKPDIILLDLMLSEKSGYNVLKEIRDRYEDLSTTVIISSALSEREDIVQCTKYGIQGYMVKPINPKELNQKILKMHGDSHPSKAAQVKPFRQNS